MANSRLGIETKAITEGALMAGLTAILALAGIFIPLLSPIVMLIWTLPVVVICLRYGMKAGALTMAAAAFALLLIATPLNALDLLIRSAAPALVLGYGLHRGWRSEKTLAYTSVAALIGIALSLAISIMLMGISLEEMFGVDAETINEVVQLAADYGLLTAMQLTEAEFAASIAEMFTLMLYLIPAGLLITALITALTNLLVARLVLGKLRLPLPPAAGLASFRLPLPFILGLILGMGLPLAGSYLFPGELALPVAGQNITFVFMTLYFFQGMGLISFYLGRVSPQSRRFLKLLLIVAVFLTSFYLLLPICLAGVADVFVDFRKIELATREKGQK
jgi:uncharacterized protein YybS (DUF2232 family)